MKRILALLLSCTMLMYGCAINQTADSSSESSVVETTIVTEPVSETTEPVTAESTTPLTAIDTHSEEYIQSLGFTSLSDPELLRYVEDTVYADLVNQLNSDEYFIENVEAVYISKEYLDELAYNSQENIYFGYKLSELDEAFQGEKYIFRLSDTGETEVVPFEEYDDTYDKVIRNVAIGTGVILLCVTVSVVTGGVGAPAASMIFAASAKSAAAFALSSGVISGASAGIVEGYKTHDYNKALKAAALKGSEGFMWGACTGAVTGGVGEAVALKGATLNGLTMNEAAVIQKESKYPLDVIKQFSSTKQFEICKEAGLTADMVSGKTALIRNIDLNYVDEATGLTNLERMQQGLAALDPSGKAYELHHIGQHADSTLAILTQEEHRIGDSYKIWHELGAESEIDRAAFDKIRKAFWQNLAKSLT